MSSIAKLTKSASIIFSMTLSSSASCEPRCLRGRGGGDQVIIRTGRERVKQLPTCEDD